LPKVSGEVLNVAAGGWPVPRQLLDFKKVKKYTTYDKKWYGDNKNPVDVYGDIEKMPSVWTNKWDCVICNQALECFPNPFKAMSEIRRVLKPNGVLLIDVIFNYVWFGYGSNSGSLKKKNPVKDYWRISKDGVELLLKDFSKVNIQGFGGASENDRYVYCVKAIK
jgi:SAM-dependent methyltransferase